MLLDGKAIASKIESDLREAVGHIKGRKPSLAFVRVGEDPASIIYLRMKQKHCQEVGMHSVPRVFPSTISEAELIEEIERLNQDPSIDGILVQLPLPASISPAKVIASIDPNKDVDGFHPLNVGKLVLGQKDGFFPCTPYGIQLLLFHSGIKTEGKHVVIVGRSNIVGKPLASLLVQKEPGADATVTLAHSSTKNLAAVCRSADILVAAIGTPLFIKKDMVRDGAVVIDVGINRVDGKVVGDVDFENVAPKCSHITPVPGGVGPMTIALLLSNTLLSYQRREQ